jgi:hypothetical protein
VQWSVDQTAAYAAANIDSLLSRSEMQGYNMLRWYHKRKPKPLEEGIDIRNYYLGVLDDSAELGTEVHEWAQADIDPSCTYPDATNYNELFWQMVDVWDEFKSQHTIEPLLTETTVWNETFGYAGTFDCLWYIDGVLTLLDIKTSRSLWDDHQRQLAALKNGETVLTDVIGKWKTTKGKTVWDGEFTEVEFDTSKIERYGFLHVRPDDSDNNGNFIPRYCEFVEATDLDLHFESFKGLLASARANKEIADRVKERESSKKQNTEDQSSDGVLAS